MRFCYASVHQAAGRREGRVDAFHSVAVGRRAPSGSRLERIVDNQFWALGSGLGTQELRAVGMELPTRQMVFITASEMQAEMETPSWWRRNSKSQARS